MNKWDDLGVKTPIFLETPICRMVVNNPLIRPYFLGRWALGGYPEIPMIQGDHHATLRHHHASLMLQQGTKAKVPWLARRSSAAEINASCPREIS